MAATPFTINVPDRKIDRLRQKLALTDFPDDITTSSETSWDQGAPLLEIKRLATAWQTSYDWRKAEDQLNGFPNFLSPIEVGGLGVYKIHHIHRRSLKPDAIPLLFLHGWPGCFLEVTKLLESLTKGIDAYPAFHIVAPSLIDFGFSSGSGKATFSFEHHAEAYDKLMQSLGYNQYGGDFGYLIGRLMSKKYGSTRVKGFHTNTPAPGQPDADKTPEIHAKMLSTPLTSEEQEALGRTVHFSQEGMGYYKQASTKPQTLAYSLRDSPVGLLAWICEKLHCWTDNYPWTDEEILTWTSIYYFSTAGPDAPSKSFYAIEHSLPTTFIATQEYVDVPLGVARFKNDIVSTPRLWNHTLGPIVYESDHERGAHFAAWEQPGAIIADIQRTFGRLREMKRL